MGQHHLNTPRQRIEKYRKKVTLILAREWLKAWSRSAKEAKLVDASGAPISAAWPEMPKVQYFWPHDEYMNKVELREGNPPSDSDRPEWLRGIDLWLDPAKLLREMTEAIRDRLGPQGVYDDFAGKEAEEFLEHYFKGDKANAIIH